MKETLNNQAKKPIATRVIIEFLYLILTLNNFLLNDINYLQQKGCLCMQTLSWENLKNYTFTPTLEIFQHFAVGL